MKNTKLVLFTDLDVREIEHLPVNDIELLPAGKAAAEHLPDGALFIHKDPRTALEAISNWRKNAESYLLPVIVAVDDKLASADPELRSSIHQLADYYADILQFTGANIPFLTSQINTRIKDLKIDPEISSVPRARLMLYLATRNISEISPIKDLRSTFGYTWPLVGHLIDTRHIGDEAMLLDGLVSEGLLRAETVEVIHVCPVCENARIASGRSCSKCGSSVIKQTNIVHHYSCGGVFPEQDGWTDDGLRCVKCHRKLVHIGVDYERPVSVDYCTKCGHTEDIFDFKALCFECHHVFPLSDSKNLSIKSYKTARGAKELVEHFRAVSPSSIMELRYVEPIRFSEVLKFSQEHLRRRMDTFSLLTLGLDQQLTFKDSVTLVKHLATALRDTDLITRSDEFKISAILRSTPMEEAEKCIQRIRNEIGNDLVKNVRIEEYSNEPGDNRITTFPWNN